MKKLLAAIIVLLFVFGSYGCMSAEEKEKQREIVAYLEAMKTIETQKNELSQDFIVIENSSEETEVSQLLASSMVPKSAEINTNLQQIELANSEIEAVHEYFVNGWAQLNSGLIDMKNGLETTDVALVEAGNSKIEASQITLNNYYAELENLCRQYRISLETEVETEEESN